MYIINIIPNSSPIKPFPNILISFAALNKNGKIFLNNEIKSLLFSIT